MIYRTKITWREHWSGDRGHMTMHNSIGEMIEFFIIDFDGDGWEIALYYIAPGSKRGLEPITTLITTDDRSIDTLIDQAVKWATNFLNKTVDSR